jgi:uncharacterized protein (DUF697 family)
MMAMRRRMKFALPVNPTALLDAIGLTQAQSASLCRVTVFVDTSLDPALLAYAQEAFRPQIDNLILTVIPYFDEPPQIASNNTLVVILAAEAAPTGRILIEALKEQIPAVVMTLNPARLQQIAHEHYHQIDLASIVTTEEHDGKRSLRKATARNDSPRVEKGEGLILTQERERFARLFLALGDWIVRELADDQLVLARAFGFVRGPFVENAIRSTSLQNAAIAAVFFLPGADMPLLTLNQAKLFLRIAAAYDATVDQQRLRELVVLLLGGFGFRALARRLVGVIPLLGWAIRGGVGYVGTVAVGKATQRYFEEGGDLKLVMQGLGSNLKPPQDEKPEQNSRVDS